MSLRTRRTARIAAAVTALVSVTLLSAACGGQGGSGSGEGSIAKAVDLKGVKLTVGGKEFTEQKILCRVTADALESAGAEVTRKCDLNGSTTVRTALTSGQIDLYWEYTGTSWITYLKHTKPIPDEVKQYDAVAKEDLAKNKIKWLNMSPLNNTYAIAVANETASRLQTKTISDYAKVANQNPSDGTVCIAAEFANRDDGFPGLEKAYGFKIAKSNVVTLQEGAIYNAIDKHQDCNFGEATTVDGRLKALGLTTLQDDKKFFPQYNAAVTVRQDVLTKNPKIAQALNPIAKAYTNQVSQQLNGEVDVKGHTADKVAEDWLKDKGFVK